MTRIIDLIWRRRMGVLCVLLGVLAAIAGYFALTEPGKTARQVKEDSRQDNAALCEFFRTTDRALNGVTTASPKTATGATLVESLLDMQVAARDVAASRICPLPKGNR